MRHSKRECAIRLHLRQHRDSAFDPLGDHIPQTGDSLPGFWVKMLEPVKACTPGQNARIASHEINLSLDRSRMTNECAHGVGQARRVSTNMGKTSFAVPCARRRMK